MPTNEAHFVVVCTLRVLLTRHFVLQTEIRDKTSCPRNGGSISNRRRRRKKDDDEDEDGKGRRRNSLGEGSTY